LPTIHSDRLSRQSRYRIQRFAVPSLPRLQSRQVDPYRTPWRRTDGASGHLLMPFADTSSPNSPPLFKASLDLRLLSISVSSNHPRNPSGPTRAHRKAHLSTFFNMIHLLRP